MPTIKKSSDTPAAAAAPAGGSINSDQLRTMLAEALAGAFGKVEAQLGEIAAGVAGVRTSVDALVRATTSSGSTSAPGAAAVAQQDKPAGKAGKGAAAASTPAPAAAASSGGHTAEALGPKTRKELIAIAQGMGVGGANVAALKREELVAAILGGGGGAPAAAAAPAGKADDTPAKAATLQRMIEGNWPDLMESFGSDQPSPEETFPATTSDGKPHPRAGQKGESLQCDGECPTCPNPEKHKTVRAQIDACWDALAAAGIGMPAAYDAAA